MENVQANIPLTGPGPNGALLRLVFIETFENSGIFNLTVEPADTDASYPSLESGLTAAANRIGGVGGDSILIDTAAVPALQPTAARSGATFITNRTSTTTTYTLPAASAANAGLKFRFLLGNVGTELLVNPIGTDTISIKGANTATAANITTAAGAGIKNTAATHILGDTVELLSDGAGQWKMTNESGTWAAQ